MVFYTDKQTISDIDLFESNKSEKNLFAHYNKTKTIGGQFLLNRIFNNPISDLELLEQRKSEIMFSYKVNFELKLHKRQYDFVEYYINHSRISLKANFIDAIADKLKNKLKSSNDLYIIREGVFYLGYIIKELKEYIIKCQKEKIPKDLAELLEEILAFINYPLLDNYINNLPSESTLLTQFQINKLDNHFRKKRKIELKKLMDLAYKIDVLQTLANFIKKGYCLPKYSNQSENILKIEKGFHPLIENAVHNSFSLSNKKPLMFLTGPNMSGKSTFLKTIASITYCSHLGIPLPASHVTIPLTKGIFTTINLPDDLSQGHSHFYSEVSRLKKITLQLKDHERLFIIFDELFRGINVKDAYDGTLTVIKLISKIKNAYFFISTHIIEVADKIKDSENISFVCFGSNCEKGTLDYTYQLKQGVSTERVGLHIIKKEGIIDILSSIIKKQNQL